jgi:hypothetical protein
MNKINHGASFIVWTVRGSSTARIKWIFRPTAMPILEHFAWIWSIHGPASVNTFEFSLCFTWHGRKRPFRYGLILSDNVISQNVSMKCDEVMNSLEEGHYFQGLTLWGGESLELGLQNAHNQLMMDNPWHRTCVATNGLRTKWANDLSFSNNELPLSWSMGDNSNEKLTESEQPSHERANVFLQMVTFLTPQLSQFSTFGPQTTHIHITQMIALAKSGTRGLLDGATRPISPPKWAVW